MKNNLESRNPAKKPFGTSRIVSTIPARIASAIPASFSTLSAESTFVVWLVAAYVFLLESRVLDLSPIWWMHIPMITLSLLIVITLFRGNFKITFRSKISIMVAAFTAWVALCVPFSKWRAASMGPLQSQLQALLIFIIIVQAIRTPQGYRRITGAYAYAILVASIMSFFLGRSVENGRLALAGGTLGDPNEFAMALVVGLPFWWDKASAAKAFRKIYCLLCTVPIFITFGKTGSRSGLFTLLMLVAVTFLLASAGRKLMIAAGCAILVLASTFLLPEYIRARFMTIFSPAAAQNLDAEDAKNLESDINSTEGRKALLQQSIQMTFENPIFGVGPGVFSYAGWDERKATTGVGGLAQVTHNTYTQISSETGIPGLILFFIALVLTLKAAFTVYRALRKTDPALATSGRYLFCMLMAFSVGIFFLSVGYTHTITTLMALTVSLVNLEKKGAAELSSEAVEARALVSAPSPFAVSRPIANAPATAQARTPFANSKAIRAVGLTNKRSAAEPAVRKSS